MALIDGFGWFKSKPKTLRRPDLATQWTLMWWKFRQHRLAMVGMALLGMFLACVLFAEAISPYRRSSATRNTWSARR
jgi:ABC-type antimicrobial peptide transport system permease subunit